MVELGTGFRCDRAEVRILQDFCCEPLAHKSEGPIQFQPLAAGVEAAHPVQCVLPPYWQEDSAHRYSLMSSSLTADGVSTPRSVNSRVMRDGGV